MRHLRPSQLSPMGALARGALAGAIGTAAMDAVWYAGAAFAALARRR